ncbi:MAG: restriction endonuclease [Planctomycetes bacterium]|nr:restriction endonuclease [Planctomycetota bacterium]
MKLRIHNHRNAKDIISRDLLTSLVDTLERISINYKYDRPPYIRESILNVLFTIGWSDKVRIDPARGITVTSMCKGVALALQTGNMARFYADLLKLQTLYKTGKANAAIFLVFTKEAAKKLGSNLAHYERLVSELAIFKPTITIPIAVIGIE